MMKFESRVKGREMRRWEGGVRVGGMVIALWWYVKRLTWEWE
jgi:hypothetical protein